VGSCLHVPAIAAAHAEWDRVREEKIRGGGGGGGKQDEEEDNGKFVSFVPLPTQAEIESAILAKRKAELLQVRRVARCSIDRWSKCVVCFCACARLMHLRSDTRRRSCLNRRPSRLLLLAPASAAGSNKTREHPHVKCETCG
jgi:hypothetical protein